MPQIQDSHAPLKYPVRFEIKADKDWATVPTDVIKAPIFFSDGKVGKTICYTCPEGGYMKDLGKLVQCTVGGCCLFFPASWHTPPQQNTEIAPAKVFFYQQKVFKNVRACTPSFYIVFWLFLIKDFFSSDGKIAF